LMDSNEAKPGFRWSLPASLALHVMIGIAILSQGDVTLRPRPIIPISTIVKLVPPLPLPLENPPLSVPKVEPGGSSRAASDGPAAVPLSPEEAQGWEADKLTAPPVSGPSTEEPWYGINDPNLPEPPMSERAISRLTPNGVPLPDITSEPTSGPRYPRPPSGLPAPVSQRGELYQGHGSADLEVSTEPSFTGPKMNLPPGDLPSPAPTHGEGPYGSNRSGSGMGTGNTEPSGERYKSGVGSGTGSGTGIGSGSGPAGPLVKKDELSGLILWLRLQHTSFPPVVRSYLETGSGTLCGVTNYSGYDIFVQFAEDEHQLKIFLSRGSMGILLADSDFRQRSQLFAQGGVSRDATGTISAIEAMREKPSDARTMEFYRVFGDWMASKGIKMGAR
jgi:hypothetical protein